jgi:hypothetical protein
MAFLIVLLYSLPSSADVTFYIQADGENAFIIEGGPDIKETATVEITVAYDPAILADPQPSVDGGTVEIIDAYPGRLVFTSKWEDAPPPSFLGHLHFEKVGGSPEGKISVKGKVVEEDGTASSTRTFPSSSSLSLLAPTDDDPAVEAHTAAENKLKSSAGPDIPVKAENSVLQRFREFRGERVLKAFTALFEGVSWDMLVQEPPVVLSDGKTPVTIRYMPRQKGGSEPNIALSEAKLVQVRNESEQGWSITALPDEGTWQASLIVRGTEALIDFPLVVAPPVKIREEITEKNFVAELDRFISERGDGRKNEHDPSRNYIDEYIFTANYLAVLGKHSAEPSSEQAHQRIESRQ